MHSGYILALGKVKLDLHNDYDLVDVRYDVASTSACVDLRRTSGGWVNESMPRGIVLRFEQVSRFIVKAGDPALAADRTTICFAGFLYPDDEAMDGYLDDLTDPTQDIIIGMEDGAAYKIQATRVTVAVDDP